MRNASHEIRVMHLPPGDGVARIRCGGNVDRAGKLLAIQIDGNLVLARCGRLGIASGCVRAAAPAFLVDNPRRQLPFAGLGLCRGLHGDMGITRRAAN